MLTTLSSLLPTWRTQNPPPPPPPTPHPNQSITTQNLQTSPLCSLPLELLLQIDAHLELEWGYLSPNAARMAFRATCLQFRHLLPLPDGLDLTKGYSMYERRAYVRILRAARFRTLCETELNGTLSETGDKMLVCSTCRTAHVTRNFSLLERRKDPEKRSCIGAQKLLELCPHVRFNYHGVKMHPVDFKCTHEDHNKPSVLQQSVQIHALYEKLNYSQYYTPTTTRNTHRNNAKPVLRRNQQPTHYETLTTLRLANLERNPHYRDQTGSTLKESLQTLIQSLDWKICPHLHTSFSAERSTYTFPNDIYHQAPSKRQTEKQPSPSQSSSSSSKQYPTLFSWLPSLPFSAKPTPPYRPSRLTPSLYSTKWLIRSCSEPHCDTQVFLVRETQMERGEWVGYLVLRIERGLGALRSADEEGWLAQTEMFDKEDGGKVKGRAVREGDRDWEGQRDREGEGERGGTSPRRSRSTGMPPRWE